MRSLNMRSLDRVALLSLVVAAAAATSAPSADAATYTDRLALTAASSELQTIDFEGLPPTPRFDLLTLQGVGFRGFNGIVPATTPSFGYLGPGTALINIGVPESTSITVVLPPGITSVGADLLVLAPDNRSPVSVVLSTGQSLTLSSAPLPGRSFVGFTSEVEITSLLFASGAGSFGAASRIGLDDFVFGIAKPIPEPTSAGLLSAGLLVFAWGLRRRSKTRTHDGCDT